MSVTGGERQLRQSVEVDDDGSMVLVQRPANVTSSSSDLAVMLPGGRYVKSLGSAGDIYAISRENLVKDDRLQSFSGTVLWGLTTAMKVESALYLLKRELCLYQEFDGACGDIFHNSEHEDFFHNINEIIIQLADEARLLSTWVCRRSNRYQTPYIHEHLSTARLIVNIWNDFFDWRLDVSNEACHTQLSEVGGVRLETLRRRREEFGQTVQRLLRLLGEREMDEGARGILGWQNTLRRQWRADGLVGKEEADRMGWVFGVGF